MATLTYLLKLRNSLQMTAGSKQVEQSYSQNIILKRKSFATLTKMLVPFFGPKQSNSDNAIDKSLYLPCLQHKIRMVWLMVAELQQ